MAPWIIGISGQLGAGKDHLAGEIASFLETANVLKLSFADALKMRIHTNYGVSLDVLFGNDKPEAVRKLLQREGTEARANKPNIWVDTLQGWVQLHDRRFNEMGRTLDIVIVSDVRFPNEADWIVKQGGLMLQVCAPIRNSQALEKYGDAADSIRSHTSERSMDGYEGLTVVKNDPTDDHEEQLNDIFQYVSRRGVSVSR
jgi:hypothetical protein